MVNLLDDVGDGGIEMFIRAEDQMWLNLDHVIQFHVYENNGKHMLRAYLTDQTWQLVGRYDTEDEATERMSQIMSFE